jgi:hypothetical protein
MRPRICQKSVSVKWLSASCRMKYRERWRQRRVQWVVALPSLIHCSAIPLPQKHFQWASACLASLLLGLGAAPHSSWRRQRIRLRSRCEHPPRGAAGRWIFARTRQMIAVDQGRIQTNPPCTQVQRSRCRSRHECDHRSGSAPGHEGHELRPFSQERDTVPAHSSCKHPAQRVRTRPSQSREMQAGFPGVEPGRRIPWVKSHPAAHRERTQLWTAMVPPRTRAPGLPCDKASTFSGYKPGSPSERGQGLLRRPRARGLGRSSCTSRRSSTAGSLKMSSDQLRAL